MSEKPAADEADNVRHLHEPSGDFDSDCSRLARELARAWANELFPQTEPAQIIPFKRPATSSS